jgi:hypothetical protein
MGYVQYGTVEMNVPKGNHGHATSEKEAWHIKPSSLSLQTGVLMNIAYETIGISM